MTCSNKNIPVRPLPAFLHAYSIQPYRHFYGKTLKLTSSRPTTKQSSSYSNFTVTKCNIKSHSIAAAFASITLFLSGAQQIPPQIAVASTSISQLELAQPINKSTSTITNQTTPLAVVGVGSSTIQDYASSKQQQQHTSDRQTEYALADLDDARREAALAARLITAVLLGCLVGVERRSTLLNLGVRSVTITSLSAAMIAVVGACTDVTGVPALFPLAAAAPVPAAVLVGLLAGIATYVASKTRLRPTRNAPSMSWVVGLVVTMGASCGAGLSLLAAFCYGAAVFVMRGGQRKDRKLARSLNKRRSKSASAKIDVMGEDSNSTGTRVLEVGSSPPLDSMG